MKKIKYEISEGEDIGLGIPSGAILDAYLIVDNGYDGLVYLPRKLEWIFNGKKEKDTGCASLNFAVFNKKQGVWIRSKDDYLNLENKTSSKYEKLIRK